MSMIYEQSSGELTINGNFVGRGYSGRGIHRNKTTSEHIENYGPLPRGRYSMIYIGHHKGPVNIRLKPMPENQMYGRGLFLIHGDDRYNDASEGCIILKLEIRKRIQQEINAGNSILEVR